MRAGMGTLAETERGAGPHLWNPSRRDQGSKGWLRCEIRRRARPKPKGLVRMEGRRVDSLPGEVDRREAEMWGRRHGVHACIVASRFPGQETGALGPSPAYLHHGGRAPCLSTWHNYDGPSRRWAQKGNMRCGPVHMRDCLMGRIT